MGRGKSAGAVIGKDRRMSRARAGSMASPEILAEDEDEKLEITSVEIDFY